MLRFRSLVFIAVIGFASTSGVLAQNGSLAPTRLSTMLTAAAATVGLSGDSAGPLSSITFRAGAMITPRGGGMVGLDYDMPSLSLGNGWHGRLDADVIFKANFGGINTVFPVTFDQLYYSAREAGGHNIYYGGGVGAVLSGRAVFDGKLVLGTELTSKLGAEVNLHFTEHDTIFTAMARIHL